VVVARKVSLCRIGCRQRYWALLRRGRISDEADQVARYIGLFAIFGRKDVGAVVREKWPVLRGGQRHKGRATEETKAEGVKFTG
jgi:hypothetical protein